MSTVIKHSKLSTIIPDKLRGFTHKKKGKASLFPLYILTMYSLIIFRQYEPKNNVNQQTWKSCTKY